MTWRTIGAWLLGGCLVGAICSDAGAQGVSVDVSAGQVVYQPLTADISANNASGTVRFDAPNGLWVYGTAAAPLSSGDSLWGAFGTGGRFLQPRSSSRSVNIGVDLGAHGFLFHDADRDRAGHGGNMDAIPFVRAQAGAGSIEVRSGLRGEMLSYLGVTTKRSVFETDVRAAYGAPVRVQGDARWVRAVEGVYPFLGGTLTYDGTSVKPWVQLGRWVSTQLDDVAWAGGVDVPLGRQAAVWANIRQDAPDPLYWNLPRRSWSVGVTRRFNQTTPVRQSAPPDPDAGSVLIRVSATDAHGETIFIAGDFNNWQPAPMRRDGREWMIRLPLAPGVYHYAFRSESGEWFVPVSVPNRVGDGMGGHVGVLVVS